MRLLMDNSVSWRLARDLREAGHDTQHIADLGLASADDRTVYLRAVLEKRVIVTQDSDFGPIHAASSERVGVVLLRMSDGSPAVQAGLLAANLPALQAPLERGAFVIIDDELVHILEAGA